MRPLVVVGDALLDRDVEGSAERLCPEAPVPVVEQRRLLARPGGAGLAAALAAADGRDVVLVTALGRDAAGRELGALLAAAGIRVVDLGLAGRTPEKVRVRADGQLLVRVDRGGVDARTIGPLDAATDVALRQAAAVLVADYGGGVAGRADVRAALAAAAGRAPLVWDPHPRGREPVPDAALATPNRSEGERLVPAVDGEGLRAAAERARALRDRWGARAVAVTLGAEGALLVEREGEPFHAPAPAVPELDVCGAGDRFAATAAGALADGALTAEAVEAAVRSASGFVAAGGAAAFARALSGRSAETPPPHRGNERPFSNGTPIRRTEGSRRRAGLAPEEPAAAADADAIVAAVRAAGGTVVATGGCFDLLHAGHVLLLERARRLGDCLVVCVNSDASVRRLKGPGRPLVSEEDRIAVLSALAAVDAVVVFGEDTPAATLERLRPDLWVKGGDYTLGELPEAQVVRRWGGQAVVLPYVPGRSTTRLIAEAQARG